jgi:hypothetical protein
VAAGLQLVEVRQIQNVTLVELFQKAMHRVQASGTSTDETQARAQYIALVTPLGADLMSLRDHIESEELSECFGVYLVGFDFGVANGFEILSMGELERDALLPEQVAHPVPSCGGFDNRAVGTGLRSEVGCDGMAVIAKLFLFDGVSLVIDGSDEGGSLVQVDAAVVSWLIHGGPPLVA